MEFANHLQLEGRSKYEAVIEAGETRLRPILMTTVATIVGHFPLVLATGAGAGARNSIGIVLVTGMFIGTIFTLVVVPAIYTLVARDRSGERRTPKTGQVDKAREITEVLHGTKQGAVGQPSNQGLRANY